MQNPEFSEPEEIKNWITDTIKHSIHIEYYMEQLQIGRSDIQRPHDLIGEGNKLEWPCIRGFAMQYYRKPNYFDLYVKPALEYHRQQFHHLAWNGFNPSASPDSMRVGAVDAVCSMIEPRGYQGGCHTFEEIYKISENNPIHKVAWMQLMVKEMILIKEPNLSDILFTQARITGKIPSITSEKFEVIEARYQQTLKMLQQDHGIVLTF